MKFGVEIEHKHAYIPGMKWCSEVTNYKHGSGAKLKAVSDNYNICRIRTSVKVSHGRIIIQINFT